MSWRPSKGRDDDLPQPLSGALDRVARRLGAPRSSALSAVFARWEEIVGEGIAQHARPLSLRNGALVVGVDEPGWATQVKYLTTTLLERLVEVAGEGAVTTIEVRVRPRS
jgi:predicted nucleic acid-binding Zn ribbon protein